MQNPHPDIGILVVAHGDLAAGLVSAAAEILGDVPAVQAVRIDPQSGNPKTQLATAIATVDQGAGVLALTDLFGGTPANLALALCPEHHLEVVTGANLPMLIRALTRRTQIELVALAEEIAAYGRKQILLPNTLLGEKAAT